MDLLDVGCGPGSITVDLAARVAPGLTCAVDAAPAALEAAPRKPAGVNWAVADVRALPFDDASFDVVHAHQVLQHLADPVGALREMARVCRPGGQVAVRDADYAAMTWYPASSGLSDWLDLYRRVARHNGGEPDAGRRLLAWAGAAGLTDCRPSSSVWCFATPEDRQWWAGQWADRVLHSALASTAPAQGLATRADLERMAESWRDWSQAPDGWFAVLHGEVIARP